MVHVWWWNVNWLHYTETYQFFLLCSSATCRSEMETFVNVNCLLISMNSWIIVTVMNWRLLERVSVIQRKLISGCEHYGRADHALQKHKWLAKLHLIFLSVYVQNDVFSTINLTLQVQSGGKMQFYSWRGLKQRREEFIPKDRNEAGNAIHTPALC